MKWKKILSGILTGALLLTSFAPVSAAVEEVPVDGTVEEITGDVGEAPVPIAEYGFEDTLQNSMGDEADTASAVVTKLTAWSGDVTYTAGRKNGTKAVQLGDYGLQLNKKNIGTNYTVSGWFKADGVLAENQSVLFLGYHNPEKWVGIAGNKNNSDVVKVWTRDPNSSDFNGWFTLNTQSLPAGEWHCLTLTQDESGLVKTYMDGELVDSNQGAMALDGENQDVYLGVTSWDPEFTGAVDDVKVYDRVLTADEVYDYCYDPVKSAISDEALETYDFNDFAVSEADAAVLTDGERNVSLVTVGTGEAPSLVTDETRGTVLKTVRQGTADDGLNNIGYALLPSNPFEGQSVDNGLTLNFWANTQGSAGGNRTMIDFEVAPATEGRAGTFAFNQSMVYWNTTDQDGSFTDFNVSGLGLGSQDTWKMVTMTVTTEGINFYSNGRKINHTVQSGSEDYETMIRELAGDSEYNTEGTKIRLGASVAKYWIGAGALLDDIGFFGRALSDQEVAQLYDETAPENPATAITISGEQNLQVDKTTQLSVALTPAEATGLSDLRWSSSDDKVVKIDQSGFVQAVGAGTAIVTARIGSLVSNELEIQVEEIEKITELDEGYYLAVYSTTTPFYASAANLDQETQSVYYAVSKDGKTFEVLNNGGGVIFSSNTEGTLKVTEPKIYKERGKFTVIAPDSNKSKGYHVFTSKDGVNYYDDTIVAFPSMTAGVLDPSVFSLMLDGENLLATDSNITLGNAVALTEAEYTYIVNKLGTVVNTTISAPADVTITEEEGKTITAEQLSEKTGKVTAGYSDGSTQEFSVDWSEALAGVDLSKAGTYELTGKVNQTKYLNNLKELNGSTLPEDDPDNENTDYPSNYNEATGEVYYDETKFIEGMADPMIYWDEQTGYYYMTASYFPEDGDQIDANDNLQQYDRVVMRRAKTLEGLQDRSKQVTIWKVGNQGYDSYGTEKSGASRYIWAPEIHRVGDYWVVYFTESHGGGLYDIYCHALVLDGDKDPYETALESSDQVSEWKDYKMQAYGGSSVKTSLNIAFCLDMTYFKDEVNGTSYVIWAGKPTAAYGGSSTDLFIATVDEEQPWVTTSEPVRLTKSDYGWERIRYCVNEGPTVLQHDGNVFLCYSVSGTGSEYAIGMLSAKGGVDLLNADTWTKSPYPLLTSRDVDGEEGPGHNSFTVDQDGNVIFVYHARPTTHNYKMCGWDGTRSTYTNDPLTDPCRHARLKRVHWAADGTPILKMTYANELLEENQYVKTTVTVKSNEVKPTGTPSPEPTKPVHKSHVGKTFVSGNLKYKVTRDDAQGREVRVTSLKKKVSTLTIPKTVTNTEWKETFKVTSVKAKAFKGQTFKKVVIGANVTKIGPNAFLNCKKLTTVTIGKNVKTIGIRAFYGCSKLKKVTIKGTALKTVKKNAFKKISRKAVIKVPKSKKSAYKKLLKGKIAKGVTIK